MNVPACIMCSYTPAELRLFGKPLCEECAHNIVSDAAAKNRQELEVERARLEPLPVAVRDGVQGYMVGDEFVPSLASVLGRR